MTDETRSGTENVHAQGETLEEAIRKAHEGVIAASGGGNLVRTEVTSFGYETGGFTGRNVFWACVRLAA